MTLSVESIVPQQALEVTAPVFEGLQVIVSLSGRSQAGVLGRVPIQVSEAAVYLVYAAGRHQGYDRFEAGTLQRYVKVGLDPQSAERNGLDLNGLVRAQGRKLCSNDVMVMRQPMSPALQAIAMQILACPVQGALRDIYLAGKGLEMVALAAQGASGAGAACEPARLSRQDLERVRYAHDLLIARYQEPPTLPELARQAGTNVKKLNAGFRQVFGMSVFEYLQEHRLQEAFRMLSAGGHSVSEVAAFIGYAIPHFSTLFRKRFGMPPSQLLC